VTPRDQCHKTHAVLPLRVFADHARHPTGLIMLLPSCEPSQTVQGDARSHSVGLLTGVASECMAHPRSASGFFVS
jgi:hypothetical protein